MINRKYSLQMNETGKVIAFNSDSNPSTYFYNYYI